MTNVHFTTTVTSADLGKRKVQTPALEFCNSETSRSCSLLFQPDAEVVSQNVSLSFKTGFGFAAGKFNGDVGFPSKTSHEYAQIFFFLFSCVGTV